MKFILSYSLAWCLVQLSHTTPIERDSVGVSEAQLQQLQLFSQYSGAAYCYSNTYNANGKIKCSAGNCPLVESADTSILQSIYQQGNTKTTGYIALDKTNQLILVAIQGTSISSNPIDALTDVDIIRLPTNLCGSANTNDGCEVHQGFLNGMQDIQSIVTTTVNAALLLHPDYRVVVTGHSLGGAIASLMATVLRNAGRNVDLYTYGQPRVGSTDIAILITNQGQTLGTNFRVTHYNDVVPMLPEHYDIFGEWQHFAPEAWITINTGTVLASSIKIIRANLYSTAGNQGQSTYDPVVDIFRGVSAHLNYFGNISACTSDPPIPA